MTSVQPMPGLRIGDRYELTRRVASGGMGEVWAARDLVLDREVAVKLLRREYADDAGFVQRFRAEARHAASLTHPGIASVYDYGEIDGSAYLVMELVPGQPLSSILTERGPLSADEAVPLLQQAAHALQAAHTAGLVHRDVKPGNLLVTPDGQVKITDFGIARAGGQVALTRTGEVMGTAQYLAPEQAMGRAATASSDVYGLGVVAYEMLSGHRPFDADNPIAVAMSQVNDTPAPLPAAVPSAVASVVLQALAKDPDERPHSASDLADAFGRAMRGHPITPASARAVPPPVTQPVTSPVAADPRTGVLPTGYAASSTDAPRSDVPTTDEPPGRRSVGLWALVALLVAAVVALGVLLLTKAGPETVDHTPAGPVATSGTSTSPASSTTSAPSTIAINEADYLGKPADEVSATLRSLGLKVSTKPVTTGEYDPGTVANVSPTGNLSRGDRVTLSVAKAPATTTSPTQTPTSSPTSSTSSSSTTSTTDATQTSTTSPNASATAEGAQMQAASR